MDRYPAAREQRSAHSRLSVAAVAAAGIGGVLAFRAMRAAAARAQPLAVHGARIVIIGGGFAGTRAAVTLSRLLPRRSGATITLIDRNDFLLFTPMLTEIAGDVLEGRHTVAPLASLPAEVSVVRGAIERIDLESKSVVYRLTADGPEQTIHADHLIIAMGSVANYHQISGVEKHSIPMKTVVDAMSVRNHVLQCLETADAEQDGATRRKLLTFVVAGGGFTGVETIGAINDLARSGVSRYRHLRPSDIHSELVHPGDRLLEELSDDLAKYAKTELERHGVTVRLKTKITAADGSGVSLEPAGRLETATFIWAAGVRPSPIVDALPCAHGPHGGIVVDHACAMPGHPGVWAVGDCAEIPKPDGHGTYAPTAQNATREGALVARNIIATLRHQSPASFTYAPAGEVAVIGRHVGVAKIRGYRFSGGLAWALWRAVYVAKMPSVAQRCRVVSDWILDAVFGRLPVST